MDKKSPEGSFSRKDLENMRKKFEADYINTKASEQYVPTLKTTGVSFSGHIDTSSIDQTIERMRSYIYGVDAKATTKNSVPIPISAFAFDGYCYDKELEKASEVKKANKAKIQKPKLTIKDLLQDDEE